VCWGDFTNSMLPLCQIGGCNLYMNDTTTSFASRFRGFLNVTPALAGQVLHIGFYADDAVSLTFFDESGQAYPILTQPPALGEATWRMTQEVTFTDAGLYPVEILYAQIVEHAALEMSFFAGSPPAPFTSDFQVPADQAPIVPLDPPDAGVGFTLFGFTDFFQTVSGRPSYTNLAQCEQCNRQFVGEISGTGCDAGFYCNEAALCAPCDNASYCGTTCSPCGGAMPVCVAVDGGFDCAAAMGVTGGGGTGGGASSSSAGGMDGGASSSSAGGMGGGASSSSTGGPGGASGGPGKSSGCACTTAGSDRAPSMPLAALTGIALAVLTSRAGEVPLERARNRDLERASAGMSEPALKRAKSRWHERDFSRTSEVPQ
jgi:outer membrane exchange protein TraA